MFLSTFDPFRSIDRSTSWLPAPSMPMDAVRREHEVEIRLDVPGVSPDGLEVTVENNVLSVVAERPAQLADGDSVLARERRHGVLRRQVSLADSLDGSAVTADLADGVLTLTIPVAERSKPRKVAVAVGSGTPALDAASSDPETADA
jgi:HSP20 family protein